MGAGVERMIDPHVMLSLEYLYYGFDNVALTGPISPGSFLLVTFSWSNYNVQVVRASLQLPSSKRRLVRSTSVTGIYFPPPNASESYHNPTFPGVSLIMAGCACLMREGAASVDL
jgi:hypothetical protein